MAMKWFSSFKMVYKNDFWLRNHLWAAKWSAKMPFGCEMTSKLWNHLQAIKMTCKMKRGLRKHFAKPREVVKMQREPRNHASKEESPFTEITHKASHSISDLLKPSKPIASAEETMLPKETTRIEAKVLLLMIIIVINGRRIPRKPRLQLLPK